jgi:hypothetical protein
MKLTASSVERFKGGQMEIQNQVEEYLYRGEVATIAIEQEKLVVKFAWLAKGEGFPPIPEKWVKDDKLDYNASLQIYTVNDQGDGRTVLHSSIVGETVVLFPLGGSKLDPSKVEGLQL